MKAFSITSLLLSIETEQSESASNAILLLLRKCKQSAKYIERH